jgi:hypothetical protein
VFEPVDRARNGKYFRFTEDFYIKVASGSFTGKYLGDTFVNYNRGCGRVVAVKSSKDNASLFSIYDQYYNTCQKNCPLKEDKHCFPVILFEHCRPEIQMKTYNGVGKYCHRPVVHGCRKQ